MRFLAGENLSNSNIVHFYDEDIEYFQFRKFIKYGEKIQHCYTLKPLNFNIGDIQTVLGQYEKKYAKV